MTAASMSSHRTCRFALSALSRSGCGPASTQTLPSAIRRHSRRHAVSPCRSSASGRSASTLTSFDWRGGMLVGEGFEGVHVRLLNTSTPSAKVKRLPPDRDQPCRRSNRFPATAAVHGRTTFPCRDRGGSAFSISDLHHNADRRQPVLAGLAEQAARLIPQSYLGNAWPTCGPSPAGRRRRRTPSCASTAGGGHAAARATTSASDPWLWRVACRNIR